MTDRHPIWEQLDGIQMDLRAANAKLTALRAHIAQMQMPDAPAYACPRCGIKSNSHRKLAEHVYYTHDGPVPDHFALLEARIAPDWTPDEPEELPRARQPKETTHA